MAELKTRVNDEPVEKFLNTLKNKMHREDAFALLELMKKTTGEDPKMWGSSIVGFGAYHYTYASGREGDWPVTGFSPRKQNLTVYFCAGFQNMQTQLKSLGKFKTGVGCLYFKKMAEINPVVLKKMIQQNKKNLAAIIKLKKQKA